MLRYRDLNTYLRERFGERVQKISLDAGLGCPNRDGTISGNGCIYCDQLGSGTGAFIRDGLSIDEQVRRGCAWAEKRYGAKKYIAYLQSFTNTYAPIPRLHALYDAALAHPGMVGLSVATRPDCVSEAVLELLASYKTRYLVWLELGLQSSHDSTLKAINRGHDAACFEKSVHLAVAYGLEVCAHVILGLPGETPEMMKQTARFLAGLPLSGVKIHLLYVIKGTPLAELYLRGEYRCLDRDEYCGLVAGFLEELPPWLIIHRLTGDPFRSELVAPLWAADKAQNLKRIRNLLEERKTWQGRLFSGSVGAAP